MKLIFLTFVLLVLALQEYNIVNVKHHINTYLGKLLTLIVVVYVTKKFGLVVGLIYSCVAVYLLTSIKEGMNGMLGSNSNLENVNFNTKNSKSTPTNYVTAYKSNKFKDLFYYIPPNNRKQIEQTRLDNKNAKTTSSDRLFIEELLKHNKIHNIIINFNRGNKSETSKQKKEPSGYSYLTTKLKKDPYSCS